MRPSDSEQEASQVEPGDHEASEQKSRFSNRRYFSHADDRQKAGRSKRSQNKKITQESTLSPGKKQRLSSRGPDVHNKLGDHEATQGAICSPKNRRLSHMRPSDSEQGADQAGPGDHEATQGATRSPEKNRRLSGLAEPGDQEAIQGTIDSPRKRRLSSLRYVGGGDNQQEAGRSKRS